MCVVSCEYIYFRKTEKSGTPGQKRRRESATESGAGRHSDGVHLIIQQQEEAGTLGIDSQVKGNQHAHCTHTAALNHPAAEKLQQLLRKSKQINFLIDYYK